MKKGILRTSAMDRHRMDTEVKMLGRHIFTLELRLNLSAGDLLMLFIQLWFSIWLIKVGLIWFIFGL